MKKYEVIETNGGSLYLIVFGEDGEVIFMHDYEEGGLLADLEALKNGENPMLWDGNEENPQEAYDNVTSYQCGWEIVADNDGVYPENMMGIALEEFGVEAE